MERRQMIAVLQDGCAVNRPHGFSDIFAWLSANIGYPGRKEVEPFFYPLKWEKNRFSVGVGFWWRCDRAGK
jgi:hypothetical protein